MILTEEKKKRLKLGFLGVGWIGRNRMEALVEDGVAEAAFIADLSEESARCAAQSSSTRVCTTLEELMEHELDGIVIATPSALHAQQALEALGRGFPVFCQKPLGRTQDEVSSVVREAQRRDLLLGLDLSYRYLNAAGQIYRILQENGIGQVYAVDALFHNAYGPDKSWFYDPVLSGGGCVIDLGIHLVDLALWLLNYPSVSDSSSRLYSGGKRIRGRSKIEDYASVRLDLQSGCVINMACSWKLPAGQDAVIGIKLYGTDGALAIENVNGSFYDFCAYQFTGTKRTALCLPPDNWGGRAILDWAAKLHRKSSFDSSIVHAIDVAGVLDSIYSNR